MKYLRLLCSQYHALSPIKFSFATAALTVSSQILFFLLLITILSLISSQNLVAPLQVTEMRSLPQTQESSLSREFFITVVVGPILETLIFQWALILLLKKFIHSRKWLLIIGALAFSPGHLRNSTLSALQALILGFYFANAFIHWFEKTGSGWMAARITWLCHALHNIVYFIFNFIPASIFLGIF